MIAVVMPAYKTRNHILGVIKNIGPEVDKIYVIDDGCPEKTGEFVKENSGDSRIKVCFHTKNQGVGGAMITGYEQALNDGARIIIKIDSDGQMNPALIRQLKMPLEMGQADYTKGNRFFNYRTLKSMPTLRLLGNSALSFITKASSGYWDLMDPTNGFTAIHATALRLIDFDRIDRRYFFESDLLFRLNITGAVVHDFSMQAVYNDENSSLRVTKVLGSFAIKNLRNFFKRIFYRYYLRDFNVASIEILLGSLITVFGVSFGTYHWALSIKTGTVATTGTVMIATLPIILGFQLLLSAVLFDVAHIPRTPLQKIIEEKETR